MKKLICIIFLVIALFVSLCSCDLVKDLFGQKEPEEPTIIVTNPPKDPYQDTPADKDPVDDPVKKPCKEHTPVVDEAVEATCDKEGLTEGSHCSVCDTIIVEQKPTAKKAHDPKKIEKLDKTCTENGHTEGSVCVVCDAYVIEPTVIPASHEYGEPTVVYEATCFYREKKIATCSDCGNTAATFSAKLEHEFNVDSQTGLYTCEKCHAVVFEGHLYAVIDEKHTWFEAYERAAEAGGHLATITSELEQNLITAFMQDAEEQIYWVGGMKNTSGWQWITDEEFSYTNWRATMPDNYRKCEWYINVYSEKSGYGAGKWNDLDNNVENHPEAGDEIGFILEIELNSLADLGIDQESHFLTDWMVTKAASCFEDGERERSCKHCGFVEKEVISKLNHDFKLSANNEVEICEICGASKYEGRVYMIFNVSLSWFDGYSYCDNLGGHLVTITSAAEQSFIEEYMEARSFSALSWIGAYTDGKQWHWVTGEDFEYDNWNSGEPNGSNGSNGKEYVAHINFERFGGWNDYNSINYKHAVICEWEVAE